MNRSNFVKSVMRDVVDMANINNYFYVLPVEHILSGFFCEMTPRGAYVWRFIYPLFDTSDEIHLLYSQRLDYPEDYIDFEKVDKSNLAAVFCERIENKVERARSMATLHNFCSYCEGRAALLEHELSQMAYGFALLLLDQNERACDFLNRAKNYLRGSHKERCIKVLQLLSQEPEGAKRLILNWEDENKYKLGVRTI
ncbi:hypothetical protein ACLD02_08350 [Alloalcanivorax sp. C16-2]|uniref:hypothetical protein n=1 Tax=Alloalcanivorax sp. C16-2 TaxID=3390052 RepID=UPI0039710178